MNPPKRLKRNYFDLPLPHTQGCVGKYAELSHQTLLKYAELDPLVPVLTNFKVPVSDRGI